MFPVDGHGFELAGIRQTFECQQPRAGIPGVAGDAPEQLGVGQFGHGGLTRRFRRRRTGQRRQIPGPPEGGQRAHGGGRATGLARQRHDPLHGGITHAGVAVVPNDGGEDLGIRQPAQGRPSNARVGVFGSYLNERVGVRGVQGLNGLETNHRVAVLPSGLRAELIENTHA